MRALLFLFLILPLMGAEKIPFTLSSPVFSDGDRIPVRYSCDGQDISPPLAWGGAPQGTKSFALVVEDPDAPSGTFMHWGVYDIPVHTDHLGAAFPAAGPFPQARNDPGEARYAGPCPPPGNGVHHYHFHLMALDVARLSLNNQAVVADLKQLAAPHMLESAEIVGIYSR